MEVALEHARLMLLLALLGEQGCSIALPTLFDRELEESGVTLALRALEALSQPNRVGLYALHEVAQLRHLGSPR